MHNRELPKSSEHEPSRALVPVEGGSDAPSRDTPFMDDSRDTFRATCRGPMAGFVTQLIACRRRLPEYRTRRLAEPREATQRYDAVEHRPDTARRLFERLY